MAEDKFVGVASDVTWETEEETAYQDSQAKLTTTLAADGLEEARVATRPWMPRQSRGSERVRDSGVPEHYAPLLEKAKTTAEHLTVLEALTIDAWIAGTLSLAAGDDAEAAVEGGKITLEAMLAEQLGTDVSGWTAGWAEDNLSSLDLTNAPDALASLIDSIDNASADADAEDQADGASAWATEAGAQDAYSKSGIAQWESVANASACQICLDMESGGPYDVGGDGGTPPYHNGCDCESKPVEGNDNGS